MNTNRYYFRSSNVNDCMSGAMMISTAYGYTHAVNIAKRKFSEYKYKGEVIQVKNLLAI